MTEYFDVVIVGAGLSGIGAAYHLQTKCPNKSYVILEGRESMGGTWDLFRYPGIRSDSDMYTLGYNFKPWREAKSIADGPSILKYVQETAADNSIDKHIRYNHRVKQASWSSEVAAWTIEVEGKDNSSTTYLSCNFLLMCSGYYSYEKGYTPEFKGYNRFQGQIIHPQEWPHDLDYQDKKVVVIGSGATAITLVPEIAKKADHVVMLQRSPTYVVSRSDTDKTANLLRKLLPEKIAYAINRWKYTAFQQFFYRRMRTEPEKAKEMLLDMVRQELGPDYDIDTNFTPDYNPWDQRLCLVPNSDLFRVLKSGQASVVTAQIDSFTEKGILLKSGEELKADIIVTATGLNILLLGGVKFIVDNQPMEFSKTYTYKGLMYSGVPNLGSIFGYVNASWTLRADLMAEYVCRVINHMDKKGFRQCTPCLRNEDQNMETRSLIDNFSPGYLQRVMHLLPKQGDREPWLNSQNYQRDKKIFRYGAIEDGVLRFSNPIN
ncbi:NAD(P)/FAD-dependent oxidoreductase [Crocosphaera sp.]|uniref:flavin-containing monooxygenase n=1 Tax=Crocosphaera sp. TaxID=2729996 RepID=UPI00263777F8|nr:NAD(P)/FAD-dependent oxidoreductase [Crocosphaera sp.]MDJ0580624.1 NAD(P)/FAD-dependent oxidoreductase [Crocosphaera sp.]